MLLGVIFKALTEAFWARRFLPFFLIYFLLFSSLYIFAVPIALALLGLLAAPLPAIIINLSFALLVFISIGLINVWFTGALVHDARYDRGFNHALARIQRIYPQLLLLVILILSINALSLFHGLGSIVQVLIDWFFLFSFPLIVTKGLNLSKSLLGSFGLIKNAPIKTFLFWFLTRALIIALSFTLLLFLSFALVAFYPDLSALAIELGLNIFRFGWIGLNLLRRYVGYLLISAIISFFLAVSHTFDYLSRTYYLLAPKR
jgi:hypothetical protein